MLGIGVDLGTSGCRAVAVDARQQLLATAQAALPSPVRDVSREGCIEQNPELWWDAVLTVLRRLAARLDPEVLDSKQDMALCVDGTSATLLLCQPNGTPLGPALMYNDSRSVLAAKRILEFAPSGSAARGAASSLAKAMHLSTAQMREISTPSWALHQADWIIGRLRNQFGDSDWNNALKLGFDPVELVWPEWVRQLLPAGIMLPRVHAPGTLLGPISAPVAKLVGLPARLMLCAGTTDSTAAVIATGACHRGDAVTSLGSTLVLKLLSKQPISAPQYGVYSHRLGDQWLVGGASNSGGATLRCFFDDRRIEQLSQSIDPSKGSDLDYYPLLAVGERFPIADPTMLPRMSPRPSDDVRFLQGLFEGIARIERDGYERLAQLGAPPPQRVLSTGGGARNPVWSKIRQRLLGVPVLAAERQDAAYGAALLALHPLIAKE